MPIQLVLPNLGLGDQPIVVSAWLVKLETRVSEDEPILEVLCDGVTIDLPAPADGILAKKLVADGESLSIGQPLAVLKND